MTLWDDTFQKEEEDDGSAKLNHWNWYTKAPLCGFTSKDLKKHEMRAQEKAKRKLGDIGELWVEDKGHDQTLFSDEYFASVPGSKVWQMKWTLHWLPSTRLGKKTHSLCFHHDDKVVEKIPYSVLKQEALGILGRAPERSSLSSVVSSSRGGSINQRIGNPVMERVLNSSPRFNR